MGTIFTAPVQTRWPWFNWPGWARWTMTLSFLILVNWMLLAPAGIFKGIHVFLAHQDKIAHFGIFLVLAFLVRWSLPVGFESSSIPHGPRGMRAALNGERIVQTVVFVALVIYAGSIEVFQPLLTRTDRGFEWLDLASNYVGVCAGWLLFGSVVVAPLDGMERDTTPAVQSVDDIDPEVAE